MNASAIAFIDRLGVRYPPLVPVLPHVAAGAAALCAAHRQGGKVLLCGNGGSAADAEHIVGELMKGFALPRRLSSAARECLHFRGAAEGWREPAVKIAGGLQRGVAALALTGCGPLATAVANDSDPDLVFAQQTFVLGRAGDVLVGISTSGNSRSVVAALRVGRAFGLTTVGMTGTRSCDMDALCDVLIKVPGENTPEIQEYHLPVYHALCLAIEQELFGEE